MAAGPPLEAPAGFDSFWSGTLEALDAIEPDPVENPATRGDGLELSELEFRSLGGVRIGAYLARSPIDGPRPLVVHGHGYVSAGAEVRRRWVAAGADVCGIDVRGYGRSLGALPGRDGGGYMLTGVGSPETSVMRGAVCDHLRGIEVARGLRRSVTSRVILQGTSFAGGLATIAQALRPSADLLVLKVPSLAWTHARMRLARSGSGLELSRRLAAHPDRAAATLTTLANFDALHFADRVTCPTLVGLGERDHVVPPCTVMALYERIAGPRELMRYPVSHSGMREEPHWEGFDQRWLGFAANGVPPEFGRRPV